MSVLSPCIVWAVCRWLKCLCCVLSEIKGVHGGTLERCAATTLGYMHVDVGWRAATTAALSCCALTSQLEIKAPLAAAGSRSQAASYLHLDHCICRTRTILGIGSASHAYYCPGSLQYMYIKTGAFRMLACTCRCVAPCCALPRQPPGWWCFEHQSVAVIKVLRVYVWCV